MTPQVANATGPCWPIEDIHRRKRNGCYRYVLAPSHIRDDNCRLTPVSPVISITACSFGRPNPPSTRDATGVTMADYPQEHVSLFWPVQRENYNGTHSNK